MPESPSPPSEVPDNPPPNAFLPPFSAAPAVAPAPRAGEGERVGLWCVAKPTMPADTLLDAMDYACGEGGADCEEIKPQESCYYPDNVAGHASCAFNSYWQMTKKSGGSCNFQSIAVLINSDYLKVRAGRPGAGAGTADGGGSELPANTALQSVIPRLICRCYAHHGLPTCSRRPPEVVKRHKDTGGGKGGEKVGKEEGSGSPKNTGAAVCTTGHSGLHTVNIQAMGLRIVGPEFRLKDEKIDINKLDAFNRILHFIVAPIWDKKSKLNVSLPYAQLLTKVFQHYDISFVGPVTEKMGQAICSRNMKKSGFSLVRGVWTKTSVAEGEAIIGEAQEVQEEAVPEIVAAAVPDAKIEQEDARAEAPSSQEQQIQTPVVQAESAVAAATDVQVSEIEIRIEDSMASNNRIEDIPQEFIEPVGQSLEVAPPSSQVATILRSVLDSITSTKVESEISVDLAAESIEKEATTQGGHTASVPVNDQFREGIVESASGEEYNDENVEPIARASNKGKEATSGIPLLTRRPHQRQRKKKLKVNLKPLVARMDEQGKILCSVQSDIASIFIS
ncbi:hypothetical protein Taro_040002 [Colocasia esculenta]|uniref:X8 domain-containing protein n=1 Tax=Colocasia esculenta TaxID=4460 RepID=A0A843WRS2_COLES|nr:hypothetical protein [Colocasia esculenta]